MRRSEESTTHATKAPPVPSGASRTIEGSGAAPEIATGSTGHDGYTAPSLPHRMPTRWGVGAASVHTAMTPPCESLTAQWNGGGVSEPALGHGRALSPPVSMWAAG